MRRKLQRLSLSDFETTNLAAGPGGVTLLQPPSFKVQADHSFRFVTIDGNILPDASADQNLVQLLSFGIVLVGNDSLVTIPSNATMGFKLGPFGVFVHVQDLPFIEWNDYASALTGGVSINLFADVNNTDIVARNVDLSLTAVVEIWSGE